MKTNGLFKLERNSRGRWMESPDDGQFTEHKNNKPARVFFCAAEAEKPIFVEKTKRNLNPVCPKCFSFLMQLQLDCDTAVKAREEREPVELVYQHATNYYLVNVPIPSPIHCYLKCDNYMMDRGSEGTATWEQKKIAFEKSYWEHKEKLDRKPKFLEK